MNPSPLETSAPPLARATNWTNPLVWRLPAIETYPRVVAFAQTFAGKLVLFAVFAGLMKLVSPDMWIAERSMWAWMVIGAALVSVAGPHRRIALLICTAVLLARGRDWFGFSEVEAVIRQEGLAGTLPVWRLRDTTLVACVPLAAFAMFLARRFRDHPLGQRPVLAQHVLYFCLLGLAASHLLAGVAQVRLWSFTAVFSTYFWYLAYALIDQRHRKPASTLFHFATFTPFFSSTVIPLGNGAANWGRVEAGTAHELAITQLKGLKLLAWALVLKGTVLRLLNWGVYETLEVPPLKIAFERFILIGEIAPIDGFLSILANFPERLLVVAVGGHVIIATIRLAGFRLLRNTCRPLSARTMAEFWNRYVYYFKEILVNVYFYPTYLRWFKRHPRLRIAFATFMAAGVGNFFFHFMENYAIVKHGLIEALFRAQSYALYCALLAGGIIVSQLRPRKAAATAGWLRRQFLPSLGVAAFFCFISFFDVPGLRVSLAEHFAFLSYVFGIDQWIKAIG